MLNLSCGADGSGEVINLLRANYGRFSITICNEHGDTEWSVNCMSHRSLRALHSKYVALASSPHSRLSFPFKNTSSTCYSFCQSLSFSLSAVMFVYVSRPSPRCFSAAVGVWRVRFPPLKTLLTQTDALKERNI